jgi:hypothetical protein
VSFNALARAFVLKAHVQFFGLLAKRCFYQFSKTPDTSSPPTISRPYRELLPILHKFL